MFELGWANINQIRVSMSMLLTVVVVFLLLLLWVWHRRSDSTVDLKDLICSDGQLDEKKFTRFGAWIVSTWGFVYMIIDDQFTEWYFVGYMGVWVTNAILDRYFVAKTVAPQSKPSK